MTNVEQTQKMVPFITCEVSLGQYVFELVFGVNVLNLDFGVQIDSIKKPIKSNSVGSGNMSHCRASFLYDHLDHCFVVFKHIQQSFLMRNIGRLREQNQHYPNHWSLFGCACVCESFEEENKLHVFSTTSLSVRHGSASRFQKMKRSDPMDQEREYHPTSILHPKKWFLILLNCVKLKFFLAHPTCWNRCMTSKKRTMFHPKWILIPQDLPQNQSLETVPICIALQYFPHNTIVCIHMCDECKKSNDSGVCHKLWSIS